MSRIKEIAEMAASIPAGINLDDSTAVAVFLFSRGYRGEYIGDDLPKLIRAARLARDVSGRNQITDIVKTVMETPV